MNVYIWIIYIIVAIISFLPIARIDLFSVSKKYTYFKYLSISLFIWSLITGLRFVFKDPNILYLMLLLKYPLIYFVTASTFISFTTYLKMKIPKILQLLLGLFLVVEIFMALTNHWHQLFLEVEFSPTVTADMIINSSTGVFFLIHTLVCYLLLFISTLLIFIKMYGSMKKNNDSFPFILIVFTIIFGVVLNFIQVFVYTFVLDPSFIIYVVFTTVIYFVFYIRDVRLILKMNNNKFILDNIREMYLIVNHNDEVVSASKSLLERFKIKLDESIPISDLMSIIKKTAVVYSDSKDIDYSQDKTYIHMKTKDINIPFLKYPGHMILFYDETQIQKYIHDMDYVMNHDLMTEIYNRNYLESIRSKFDKTDNYTCIIFDLDGLKLFNDYLGHRAGDKLLKRFADELKSLCEKDNKCTAIRMGGDEFLLIVRDSNENEILRLIEILRVNTEYSDPLKHIGFSYGYHTKVENQTLSQVLSNADIKMYQMKSTREIVKKDLELKLKKIATFKD